MLKIPERIIRPYASQDLLGLNRVYSGGMVNSSNINALNRITSDMSGQFMGSAVQNSFGQALPGGMGNAVQSAMVMTAMQGMANQAQNTPYQNYPQNTGNTAQHTPVHTAPPIVNKPMPSFSKPTQKGMKIPLFPQGNVFPIKAGIGWRINDSRCDVDASAFLLGANEKVISEDWFVFYSQPQSPDRSIVYNQSDPVYQKYFDIDLSRLNGDVQKIVFVVTIDEALKKSLNFGMLSDVYLKLTDMSGNELLSFCLSEYYNNVTSMMLGEIYKNKGQWKFNAIGNGIARDLEGLCNFYGIEVI